MRAKAAIHQFIKRNFQNLREQLLEELNQDSQKPVKKIRSIEVLKFAQIQFYKLTDEEKQAYVIDDRATHARIKRPASAYNVFIHDEFQKIKDQQKGFDQMKVLMKEFAAKWKSLSQEDREKFEKVAISQKIDYLAQKLKE